MKPIIFVIAILPLIVTAQEKVSTKTILPQIESITSDTLNGICKAIFFEYDQLKRVSSISVKKIEIKKGSEPVETFIKVQNFQYKQNEQLPFASHTYNYDYEDIRFSRERDGQSQQIQYFQFKNGKRIGDSTIYQEYEQLVKDAKFDDSISKKRLATFVQTPTKLIREMELSIKEPGRPHSERFYIDSFVITTKQNISFESSEHFIYNHDNPKTDFTFTQFDKAINPLHQLNIAPLISNEKITLAFGSDEMQQIGKCIDGLGTEFDWYYLNQNNPLNYKFERGETESPFEDIIRLSYTYNQYNQPTYCKSLVKKIFKKDNGRLAGTYKKSFTFRYKL